MNVNIESILADIEKLVASNQLVDALKLISANENNFKYNVELYSAKSIIYMLMGRFSEAELIIKKGLVLSPSNTDLLYNLAYSYEIQGEFLKAIQYYHKARLLGRNHNEYNKITDLIIGIENQHKEAIKKQTYTRRIVRFSEKLIDKLIEASSNYYVDNYDYDRFEKIFGHGANINLRDDRLFVSDFIDRFENLYDSLSDEYSRETLIEVVALRMLGNKYIKLRLSNQEYFIQRNELEDFIDNSKTVDGELYYCELAKLGYPIKVYSNPMGIHITFVSRQYEYNNKQHPIRIDNGDVVFDCGGCYGDTALKFAHDCGSEGKVYTFEFIPSNLEVMNENLMLNPELSNRVCIINHPVYDVSGEKVYAAGIGPGAAITSQAMDKGAEYFSTVSIDDFVKERNLKKVDFIKMDIEGSELKALIGARNTILKFKPKLAITIYHSIADFITIFEYLKALDIGYRFYIDHYTIYHEETVLYAVIDE